MQQQRRVDTPGDITDPQSKDLDEGAQVAPLVVEVSLWRSGRIKFSSSSQKASLAMMAMIVLLILILVLALFESFPGVHPGVSASLEKLSQALLLVLGVLLGVDWNASKD